MPFVRPLCDGDTKGQLFRTKARRFVVSDTASLDDGVPEGDYLLEQELYLLVMDFRLTQVCH